MRGRALTSLGEPRGPCTRQQRGARADRSEGCCFGLRLLAPCASKRCSATPRHGVPSRAHPWCARAQTASARGRRIGGRHCPRPCPKGLDTSPTRERTSKSAPQGPSRGRSPRKAWWACAHARARVVVSAPPGPRGRGYKGKGAAVKAAGKRGGKESAPCNVFLLARSGSGRAHARCATDAP